MVWNAYWQNLYPPAQWSNLGEGEYQYFIRKYHVINNRVFYLCVKCTCEVKFTNEVGLPKHAIYEWFSFLNNVGLLKRVRNTWIYRSDEPWVISFEYNENKELRVINCWWSLYQLKCQYSCWLCHALIFSTHQVLWLVTSSKL